MEQCSYPPYEESKTWFGTAEQWAIIVTVVVVGLTSYHLLTAEPEILPASLGELVLTGNLTGSTAQSMINHLHGKGIAPTGNVIGFYTGSAGNATLYVSVYSSREDATQAEEKMAERIRVGNPVFGEYREEEISGQPLVECRGLSQLHYFFSFGSTLYWLAVDESLARPTVERLIAHIRADGRSP
jgi:hypothetical protein